MSHHHSEGSGGALPSSSIKHGGEGKEIEENNGSCSLMLLTIAILLPPLAMAILLRSHLRHPMDNGEKVRQVVVCALLTMLCYIPGLLHVIFAMLQEEAGD